MNDAIKTTHFGYRDVSVIEKSDLVANVFHSVAPRYDLMNDMMSLGLHRLWKRIAIQEAQVREGQTILDIATGTGDLAKLFAKYVGKSGHVTLLDINDTMLTKGRHRLTDAGILSNVSYVQADAEQLPFADNAFDRISMAFGLRNITDKAAALQSMYRVLKPSGKIVILEFSHPKVPFIHQLYDLYSFHVIPKLGEWIANDHDSYQYLVESIRLHPDQETLKEMMLTANFEDVEYMNLTGGIVALHVGYKY